MYPSSVRSTAHGMSAAVGKLGALAPTIIFNYIGDRAKFWAVCWAGLLGFLVTVVFVPDATGTASGLYNLDTFFLFTFQFLHDPSMK